MSGRPQPTKLKAIKGTLQKCRTNKHEPQPAPGYPDPPAEIVGDALAEWERVRTVAPWITKADRVPLTLYCCLWARQLAALRGESAPLIASEITQLRGLCSSLGLDPAGRARVAAPADGEPKDSEWDGF